MSKHTLEELMQWQSLPLSVKVQMTCDRIKGQVDKYGEDGVYVSFSGGKDSTVLLDLVRNKCGYKNVPAVFIDTPTQYPELKKFVETFDNVVIVKSKKNFAQVCREYGFPLISKEVAECVSGARKYLKALIKDGTISLEQNETDPPYKYFFEKLCGLGKYSNSDTKDILSSIENSEELEKYLNEKMVNREGGQNQRLAIMLGWLTKDTSHPVQRNCPSKDRSVFSQERYKYFLDAPFEISNKCCNIMKKEPAHRYEKETGRHPMLGQMASESRLRKQQWLRYGCNAFEAAKPVSNPMSFWDDDDVLQYVLENNIELCSIYGQVITEADEEGKIHYKTTGVSRSGCICCAYGAHLDKKDNARFVQLKETHPRFYNLLDVYQNNGVTFREAIKWTNEHLNRGHIWLAEEVENESK